MRVRSIRSMSNAAIRFTPGLEVRKYNMDDGSFLCFSNSQVELQRIINTLPLSYIPGAITETVDRENELTYFINVKKVY